jgi:hypothetical protein
VAAFVAHLPMRKAKRDKARREMGLIANPIPRLLRGSAVVTEAIRLDDKPQIRPEKVDFEPIQPLPRQRQRHPGPSNLGQEPPLQFRVRQPKGPPIEQLAEPRHPPLPVVVVERCPQLFGIDQIESIRLVNHPLERAVAEPASDIEQGAHHTGHRDSVTDRHIRIGEAPAMGHNARLSVPMGSRGRNIDATGALGGDAPERRCACMTEHGMRPARQDCCHPPSPLGEAGPSNDIDTTPYLMQPPLGYAVLNSLRAQPSLKELPP